LDTARLLTGEILPTRSGDEALRYIAEAARELTGARYAAIGVAKSDGSGFSELFTAGFTPEEQAAFAASLSDARNEGHGILRLLLQRDEPLRLQVAPEAQGETFLGVPLRRGTKPLGALYLTNKAGGEAFTNADQANVEALGVHATVAIHNYCALERERALVAGLLNAHEEERQAIAYDLHDGLAQTVLAAHIHLEAFEYAQQSGEAEKAARELDQTSKYLQDAVAESRRLISGLRPLDLEGLGLAGALELLLDDEKKRAGWSAVEFHCNVGGQRFDTSLETAVYRIAQEALTNARKHAQTSRVKVLCERQTDDATQQERLHLQISDDGRGFDAAARVQSLAPHEGVGLYSMAERTRMLRGHFDLTSVPGEGTTISASFPILERAEEKSDDA
jgi:signal transduction histidine kinase